MLLAAYRRYMLFLFKWNMSPADLSQLVSELSPAERSAVEEFITFLKQRNGSAPQTSFQAAIDEFIASHPELLRRLAQRRFHIASARPTLEFAVRPATPCSTAATGSDTATLGCAGKTTQAGVPVSRKGALRRLSPRQTSQRSFLISLQCTD